MKRLIVGCALALLSFIVLADPVSKQAAEKYAVRFAELYFNSPRSVINVNTYAAESGIILYHFVELSPSGWVLVSGDDLLEPVIAYSPDNPLVPKEAFEESAKYWFENLDKHIISALKRTDLKTNKKWSSVYEETYPKSVTWIDPVASLIEVTWDQGAGWNRFCPEDSDGPSGHVYVGCVAVAMAQAMSYYSYPEQGQGEHGYLHNEYGYQFVDFDSQAPYNWEAMSQSVSDDENARLLYHLAVAVNMDFGPDGSGAYTNQTPTILKKYFGYSDALEWKKRENFDDETWKQMVRDELYAGRPVIYSGDGGTASSGGHAFNVDGLGTDGSFHINWGWSGSGNGYYNLDALTPGGDHDYSYGQGAAFGLRPIQAGPYDITLENTIVYDQQPSGTDVSEISISDEFEGNVYSFDLKGPFNIFLGDYGPANFYVENGMLKTGKIFDADENDSDFLIIKVTDTAGTSYKKEFDITIKKFYYGPSEISLSKASAEEGKSPGHFTGIFTVVDDIVVNSYSYSFVGGYDLNTLTEADCFYVRQDSMFTNKMFDKSLGEEYYVEVTLSDEFNHTLVDTFMIDITENISGGTGDVIALQNSFRMYPNPSEGNITIDFSENTIRADLKFYNIIGQLCGECTVNSGDRIDISYLPEGVYYTVVSTGTVRKVEKLFLSK